MAGKGGRSRSVKQRNGRRKSIDVSTGNVSKQAMSDLAASVEKAKRSSKALPGEECWVRVYGKTYDLSKWAYSHPGGPLIRQYHLHDATHVFDAFHSRQAHKLLDILPEFHDTEAFDKAREAFEQNAEDTYRSHESVYDAQKRKDADLDDDNHYGQRNPRIAVETYQRTSERSKQLLKNYNKLIAEFEEEGYMKTSPWWYAYKTFTTIAFLPAAWIALQYQYYLLSALCLGVMWQQLGWLGHEYCHHQVFPDRRWNHYMGWFLGNFLQGFSANWWKDRHNSHHATTNVLDMDPDIDNIPLLAWASSDIDRAPKWTHSVLPYQHLYFLFLLPFLRIIWQNNSVFFCLGMRKSPYKAYRQDFLPEFLGLIGHYTWCCLFWFAMPSWQVFLMHFLVSELLAGFGIAIVVFFNHYSCEKYDPELINNWVYLQIYTTRNMTPGIVTDWICGGLNYQIEHHLCPTMPRHNLYRASKKVKQFCKENGLPYMCCDFPEGLAYVLNYLKSVGQMAAERVS